jgi:hypothetical protein
MESASSYNAKTDPENIAALRRFGVNPPFERGYHASCVYGPALIVHGGTGSYPGANPFSDWHMFDFGLGVWIEVQCLTVPKEGDD